MRIEPATALPDNLCRRFIRIADHRGRREATPFRGSLDEPVTLVADTFPWTLEDVRGSPERTSDRKHYCDALVIANR